MNISKIQHYLMYLIETDIKFKSRNNSTEYIKKDIEVANNMLYHFLESKYSKELYKSSLNITLGQAIELLVPLKVITDPYLWDKDSTFLNDFFNEHKLFFYNCGLYDDDVTYLKNALIKSHFTFIPDNLERPYKSKDILMHILSVIPFRFYDQKETNIYLMRCSDYYSSTRQLKLRNDIGFFIEPDNMISIYFYNLLTSTIAPKISNGDNLLEITGLFSFTYLYSDEIVNARDNFKELLINYDTTNPLHSLIKFVDGFKIDE